MSDRDRETWERFAAAALAGMWAHPTQSVSEQDACASAYEMLTMTKQWWPNEPSGNPPELPAKTCSPRCDAVTPAAAGDETVTCEPDRVAAKVPFEDDDRLRAAALALYNSGVWLSLNVPADHAAAMWANLRDALGLEPGHATERGVGAENREAEASSRGDVKSEPDPGEGYRWLKLGEVNRYGDEKRIRYSDVVPGEEDGWVSARRVGTTVTKSNTYRRRIDSEPQPSSGACQLPAETAPPGEIGAESPEPVMYSILWDGDDTPDTEWCCSTEAECNHYLGRFVNRGGTIVPLYVVPVDAAREIAAARREAEEARKECERLRLTEEERRLLSKYHRSEERAIVQFAVTSASYVADARQATAIIGGLLARHDKGGAA